MVSYIEWWYFILKCVYFIIEPSALSKNVQRTFLWSKTDFQNLLQINYHFDFKEIFTIELLIK